MTIAKLKEVIKKKGYIWFENQPNIIAVRTSLQVPDVFNDILFIVYKTNGIEQLYTATITTEPGVYYQKNLLNKSGCFVMMPAQMIDAYCVGLHQGRVDHRCLKSVGKIYGLRDADLNGVAGDSGTPQWYDGASIGANIHGSGKVSSKIIDKWSAGCQVHSVWSKKEEMMKIVDSYGLKYYTYTLLEEKDLN